MPPLPPPANPTIDAIYQWHESRQSSGGRGHLGASQIGAPCERALWYQFRWALKVRHAGRLLRLFETGNLAEPRFVAELRAVGVEVHEINPDTGAQFSVSAVRGHFGGSMDGVALGLLEAPKTWHVLEFKTHSAKSFAALKKDGVEKSKPEHAAQMQVYMHLAGLERAFYLAVNKARYYNTFSIGAPGRVGEGRQFFHMYLFHRLTGFCLLNDQDIISLTDPHKGEFPAIRRPRTG